MLYYVINKTESSNKMKIDELDKRLDNEFSSVYKTVLVDGDWGIGKTYLIKNKYKENKNKNKYDNVIYVSVFGVNSISEINLYIYKELHKVKGLAKKDMIFYLEEKNLVCYQFQFHFLK